MFFRAPIAALFALSLLTLSANAQVSEDFAKPGSGNLLPGIRGTVLNSDGKPASGIHVELDDSSTAVPVTSTYTERDGTFELYNIPLGSYEVVAESKDSLVTDQITMQPGDAQVKLRFSPNTARQYDTEPTISVARMLVPESAQKFYRKALTAYSKGKLDKSKALVNGALQIEPQFAEALTLRGVIEGNEGDIAAAQGDLEQAVRVDPNCTSAYVALGAIYNHQGRFDDALRVSERSLTLSPRSWQSYFEMAKATIAKGMYSKGLVLAKQAQRLSGNSFAAIHLIKAYALFPMRFYKDAKYELQAFLSHEPNSKNAQQAQTLLAEIEASSMVPPDDGH